jgi:hypothetical protein
MILISPAASSELGFHCETSHRRVKSTKEEKNMTPTAAKLFDEAILLPDSDRGDLAARLIESLDPQVDEGVEAAWSDEIRERMVDLQTGKVEPVSWAKARQMIMDDTHAADAP